MCLLVWIGLVCDGLERGWIGLVLGVGGGCVFEFYVMMIGWGRVCMVFDFIVNVFMFWGLVCWGSFCCLDVEFLICVLWVEREYMKYLKLSLVLVGLMGVIVMVVVDDVMVMNYYVWDDCVFFSGGVIVVDVVVLFVLLVKV